MRVWTDASTMEATFWANCHQCDFQVFLTICQF